MGLAKKSPSSSPTLSDGIDSNSVAELAQSSTTALVSDPYGLRDGLATEERLAAMRQRKGKGTAKFLENQNNLIKNLLKPMNEHSEEAMAEEESARVSVKIAIWASLIANFALCVIQLYAAISSLSLSLIATGIDAVFDIGSNVLLFWLHKKARKLDRIKWPVGGTRLETIGNIVYGFLMGTVNVVVIVESVVDLISHSGGETKKFHLPSIIAVAASLFVKLLLFLYCYSIRKHSSQVMVLWEDHRNDLWINTFGILMSVGGSKLRWWLDPMGAILIAIGIVISWGITVYEQFGLLAGKSAPHEFLQLIIYNAATFSDAIQSVDTVRAYHSGPNYFVEVDIVMDSETPLWKAHEVSQLLQDKIEFLPDVDRAFVHVDHETTHHPEHQKKRPDSQGSREGSR